MGANSHWPPCDLCKRSFLSHVVGGLIAYCDKASGTRGSFAKDQVFRWRVDIGMSTTPEMLTAANRAAEDRGAPRIGSTGD